MTNQEASIYITRDIYQYNVSALLSDEGAELIDRALRHYSFVIGMNEKISLSEFSSRILSFTRTIFSIHIAKSIEKLTVSTMEIAA